MDDESNLTFSSTMIGKNLPRFNRKGAKRRFFKERSKRQNSIETMGSREIKGLLSAVFKPSRCPGDNISRERGGNICARL